MKDWEAYYHRQSVTAEEAIARIQPGQRLLISSYCSEPTVLAEELIRQKSRIGHAKIYTMTQGGQCLYAAEEHRRSFQTFTFLGAPVLRGPMRSGDADYIPMNMSQIPRWLEKDPVDVVMVQVTPPDEAGRCSLGISVDFMKAAIESGRLIIAEVNEKMPFTHGDSTVSVADIDCFVQTDHELLTTGTGTLTDTEQKIGEYVAELVPNRATIQIGIGNIAESVLQSLAVRNDLGLHSGTYSDGMIDLIEKGVVTNRYKTFNPGRTVSTSLTGSKRLYDFVARNEEIELHPVSYTHHVGNLSKLDHFYSINSALEVDITGQVNAEALGDLTVAGVGGQMDFIQGAKWSNGGRSIIALPATAKQGTISRIKLKTAAVTTLKSEVDYVVTEYGIAKLFGKSLGDRVRELSNVAHPEFRKELLGTVVV